VDISTDNTEIIPLLFFKRNTESRFGGKIGVCCVAGIGQVAGRVGEWGVNEFKTRRRRGASDISLTLKSM